MTLSELGYGPFFEAVRQEQGLAGFGVGRVVAVHKERYQVRNTSAVFNAELIGGLRYSAPDRTSYPVVGDWVALAEYDENKALIHAVFPRKSTLQRRAVGASGEIQVLAANIDYALIVQAVGRDFNLNRLERYLVICRASNILPIIVLSKSDLCGADELNKLMAQTGDRIPNVPVIAVNSKQQDGYSALKEHLKSGATYCLLGSSGVGKSTLLNGLLGVSQMETGFISASTGKGKHVTTHRELVVLNRGAVLIDNPGIREVGVTHHREGMEDTFEELLGYASECRFSDCTHGAEQGCAVVKAVQEGRLDEALYNNYIKIEKERAHFETSLKDKRKRDKKMGKLYKRIQNERRQNKY